MKKLWRVLGGIFILSVAALFIACGGGGNGEEVTCIDNDGDGYGENCALGKDCDDNDPFVYPGAPEIACGEGIDNNCNGEVDEGETVLFPDANLESVIREVILKPDGDILNSDLCSLTSVPEEYASNSDISDLTGLEYCTNLLELDLWGNQLSDISVLARLTNLQELYLDENNQISDISALEGLTNLQKLDLGGNQISDISALEGLTNLQELGLYNNQLSDISVLEGLTSLQELDLEENQLSDISVLARLTNLQELHLDENNQISDISALEGLTNLQELDLGGNQISDISALEGLTNLQELDLEENQISDISALVDNTGIGAGDEVWLEGNSLLDTGDCDGIAELEGRGVIVHHDLNCP